MHTHQQQVQVLYSDNANLCQGA